MTPREQIMHALECRPPIPGSRVPHMELVFFLTMEAFGRVHFGHRSYHQWYQMSETERELHRTDQAKLYIETAERFDHSAIFICPHQLPGADTLPEMKRMIALVRELSGDRYFLMVHGDATYAIPDGDQVLEFSYRLADDPQGVKDEADRRVDSMLENLTQLTEPGGLDGVGLCSDYCFNTGPFLAPDQFAEFVAPFLKRQIAGQRELGLRVIKHTDGNIMPIIDQLVDCNPHALHSLDPQGGVDIAEVKRLYGDRVCLVGNVNCGLMDTGTTEEVSESARYCLEHAMPGGGYIFSTSNCVYTGMPLDRYELILDIWREHGVYPS